MFRISISIKWNLFWENGTKKKNPEDARSICQKNTAIFFRERAWQKLTEAKRYHLNKNNPHSSTATLLETIEQYSSTAVDSFERTLDTALHEQVWHHFSSHYVRRCAQFQRGDGNIDQWWIGLGRYSQYRYSIDTDINRYVSIRSSCRTDTDDGDSCKKTTNIPDTKLLVSHMIFIQFNKQLKHIEFDLNYVELLICGKNR